MLFWSCMWGFLINKIAIFDVTPLKCSVTRLHVLKYMTLEYTCMHCLASLSLSPVWRMPIFSYTSHSLSLYLITPLECDSKCFIWPHQTCGSDHLLFLPRTLWGERRVLVLAPIIGKIIIFPLFSHLILNLQWYIYIDR